MQSEARLGRAAQEATARNTGKLAAAGDLPSDFTPLNGKLGGGRSTGGGGFRRLG
jgi:hypothetical protein